jgi:RNA polymerase sigma-70 factor (ECF subfamily)
MDLEQEKQLVEKAKQDPLAFGALYDLYYPKISNYLLHRLPRADIAADITSEVFFKAMTKLHLFSWRDISFCSWLYKIANNEVKMYYRRKERKFFSLEFLFERHRFEPPSGVDIEEELLAVEEEISRHKKFRQVQSALLCLPVLYQEVLVLRFFEEKSMSEIGEITGKNVNTVKSLLLRGKEQLRKKMEREGSA